MNYSTQTNIALCLLLWTICYMKEGTSFIGLSLLVIVLRFQNFYNKYFHNKIACLVKYIINRLSVSNCVPAQFPYTSIKRELQVVKSDYNNDVNNRFKKLGGRSLNYK